MIKKILHLTEVISSRMIQRFQEQMAKSCSIALNIVDSQTKDQITARSNQCVLYKDLKIELADYCDFLSVVERTTFSDKPFVFTCPLGFHHFAMPIFIEGKIFAYILGGQVRMGNPDWKDSQKKAEKLGITLDRYLENFLSAPLCSETKLETIALSTSFIFNTVISLAYERFLDRHTIEHIKTAQYDLEKTVFKQSKELSTREIKYQELVENLPDIVYSVDNRDIFIAINGAIENVLGYRKNEILGQTFMKIVHPSDAARLSQAFLDALNGKQTLIGFVFKGQTKKGEIKYLSLSSRRTFDEQGQLIKIEGIMRDCTAEKRLHDELFISEERNKNLVQNAVDIIYTLDRKGLIMSVNNIITERLGYLSEELLGKHFSQFIMLEDLPLVTTSFKDLVNGVKNRTEGLRFRLKKKSKGYINVELNSQAFYDSHGEFLGLEGILRDISREIDLRKSLIESNERYKSLFNSLHEIRYIADREGRLLTINQVGLALFGFKQEELIGKNIADLYVNPSDRKILEEQINRLGRVENFVAHVKRKDGSSVHLLVDSEILRDAAGESIGIHGVARLMTPQKKPEIDFTFGKLMPKLERRSQGLKKRLNNLQVKTN